ncbi:major facilitator superfamily domain-containing protein [Crucibulum laeve]|uniref:Major facilitator superfamily domain-containing protein n=1 Tax=Crucibulum laeve TaxID=68775 RepID=A0A5C3MFJ1_9AGAR|nr:major facilitator superfamily domain-containing protein [Crucibulum laeve]
MIPPIPDSDPDPTTQIPWPARTRQEDGTPSTSDAESSYDNPPENIKDAHSPLVKRRLTTWDLITLSISMAGAQIAWTVELGYGTPFLLSLGLSEQLTSLVWLAGPISGLVAQPVIGALSDSSTSKYRRRFWIILSTCALVVSTLTLAYCQSLAEFFVDLFGVGVGDWDQKRIESVKSTAIGFAVVSFYILDFALNGLQASLRNLLLDIAPPGQLNAGNAWHGRMTNAGNIIGYGFGFLPLAELPVIRWIHGSQFRKFCIICIIILVITVFITCYYHEEEERVSIRARQTTFKDVLRGIYTAMMNLPKPVRRVCYVQLFAFMGWFPFLFYSTTYVGQIMAYETKKEPDGEKATRTGEFAMLLYSIVGVIAGSVLPHLAGRDRRLMAHKGDVDQDAELTRIQETVRQWRVDAARKGKPLRLPVMPFLLRNIWTGALLFFSLLMFSTFFISTVVQATIFISLVGVCWAVAMWVPFAIIMELLKATPTPAPSEASRRPFHPRNLSSPGYIRREPNERQPLIRRRSFNEYESGQEEPVAAAPLPGGTVLGIHNLSIVMPQFIVAIVTSIIFRIVDETSSSLAEGGGKGDTYLGKNGVAWVLRFGGLCTLFGAMLTRMVSPTPTEKAMRRRLGEMKLLGEQATP